MLGSEQEAPEIIVAVERTASLGQSVEQAFGQIMWSGNGLRPVDALSIDDAEIRQRSAGIDVDQQPHWTPPPWQFLPSFDLWEGWVAPLKRVVLSL
jgi:hypothetical protein